MDRKKNNGIDVSKVKFLIWNVHKETSAKDLIAFFLETNTPTIVILQECSSQMHNEMTTLIKKIKENNSNWNVGLYSGQDRNEVYGEGGANSVVVYSFPHNAKEIQLNKIDNKNAKHKGRYVKVQLVIEKEFTLNILGVHSQNEYPCQTWLSNDNIVNFDNKNKKNVIQIGSESLKKIIEDLQTYDNFSFENVIGKFKEYQFYPDIMMGDFNSGNYETCGYINQLEFQKLTSGYIDMTHGYTFMTKGNRPTHIDHILVKENQNMWYNWSYRDATIIYNNEIWENFIINNFSEEECPLRENPILYNSKMSDHYPIVWEIDVKPPYTGKE